MASRRVPRAVIGIPIASNATRAGLNAVPGTGTVIMAANDPSGRLIPIAGRRTLPVPPNPVRSRAIPRPLHPGLPGPALSRQGPLTSMESNPGIRVDRWLWAVRLFKTRTQAAAACGSGHVHLNGLPCKPARAVRPGDVLIVRGAELTRTVRVLAILSSRVGPKLVERYLEDLTPPAEYERARQRPAPPSGYRPKGAGRPTKKERRVLGSFFGLDE